MAVAICGGPFAKLLATEDKQIVYVHGRRNSFNTVCVTICLCVIDKAVTTISSLLVILGYY